MTTFPDDVICFLLKSGPLVVPLRKLGLEWPPPGYIQVISEDDDKMSVWFTRIRMSDISDENRAAMTAIVRGAEYRHSTSEEITCAILEVYSPLPPSPVQ